MCSSDLIATAVATAATDRKHREFLIDCKPGNERAADRACAADFLAKVGRLLYRRPLSDALLNEAVDKAGESAERLKDFPEIVMVRYRIEVGRNQGITAKNIVGAIANEADIEARYIGRIDLYDDFSTIDLPEGMPRELLQHLRKVRFGKFRYDMSALGAPAATPKAGKPPRKPRAPGAKR